MSHKYVSNKATLQNKGFLSKLEDALSTRGGGGDETASVDMTVASIPWRSTKTVATRIKTATGTIAVYEDTPPEEVERLQEAALQEAGGAAPAVVKPVEARSGKLPPPPPPPPPPAPPPPSAEANRYVVTTPYTTPGGLRVSVGDAFVLITTSSAAPPTLKLDSEAEARLLDNSAAKHKMAVRPRKTRPDSRSPASSPAPPLDSVSYDEEYLMQSPDGKTSVWLPKYVVALDTSAPPPPPPPPAPKRPAEDEPGALPPPGDALRAAMLAEIRSFQPKKKRSGSKLGPSPEDEARAKRSATIRELLETEEELIKDLHYAVEHYYHHMDLSSTPRHVRDHKDVIFSNFNFFPDFHKNVLIEGIRYNAEVPRMIGKTFLRLERDFDQHAEYCSSEPLAQEFLENNAPVREYFEDHSCSIGDDKRLQEHLQLPIQRLNDYQLLLRELIKYGGILGDDTEELGRALELMQTVPQRATDAKFIASIEGYRGNLFKLGRLLRHDWFSVHETGHHRPHDRYLFLFKARVLVTKVKRISGDRSVFLLRHVIRLPETSLGSLEHPKKLEFLHIEGESHPNYPLTLEARTPECREAWLEGVKEHVVETASVDDLLFDDDIRVVSEEADELDDGRPIASPAPDDVDLELPLDDQAVPQVEDLPPDDTQILVEIVDKAPKERVIPIEVEQDQVVPESVKLTRTKGEDDSSPLPQRKKPKSDLLRQVETVEKIDRESVQQFYSTAQETVESQSVYRQTSTTFVESTNGFRQTSVVESATGFEEITSGFGESFESKFETQAGGYRQVEIVQAQADNGYKVSVSAEKSSGKSVKEEEEQQLLVESRQVEEARAIAAEESSSFAKKESGKESSKNLVESVKESSKNLVESVKKSSKNLAEPVKESSKNLVEPVKESTKNLVESTKNLVESVKESNLVQVESTESKKSEKRKESAIEESSAQDAGSESSKEARKKLKESKKELESQVEKKAPAERKESKSKVEESSKESSLKTSEGKEELSKKESAESKSKGSVKESPKEPKDTSKVKKESPKVKESPKEPKESISTKAQPAAAEKRPLTSVENKKSAMSAPQTPGTPGGGPKPIFTKTLVGAVVEPGEVATFVCHVTHPLPYFVTWLKDNKVMEDKLADRVQQVDDGGRHELKVSGCRPEDTGVYTAKATDTDQATGTCSAQLLVQELTADERAAKLADKKPFFLVRLRDTTVIETTNLSYVVHVRGDPMPDVTFFKDDKPLKEDARVKFQRDSKQGHYELLISHVQQADAGVYACKAKNSAGEASCQGTMGVIDVLDLHEPGAGFGERLVRLDASHMPAHYKTFVVATKEQEALQSLGGKGTLLAEGEKADFKWFRDGQEFDPLERFNVHYKDEEDTLALVFQNVTPEDAGLYTCVASTSCGRISCSAELTVEGAVKRLNKEPVAPVLEDPLSNTSVSAGGSAFLECKVTGFPLPELSWTRNGEPVKVGGRIKQMQEDDGTVSLIVKNVKDADAGVYRLVAKNELGEVDCDCRVAIRAGPKIKRMKKEVACDVGRALEYTVEVEGEPLPQVSWFKDGKELSESDRMQFEKISDTVFALKIKAMELSDLGSYNVMVSNDIGQRSEQFKILCDSPPEITRGLDPETEKKLSNDHTFEVRASGSPSPTARWFKDGKEIMEDDKFKTIKDDNFYMLKIRKLDRKDKGVYKIVLTNQTGSAESEGALVIRAPPEFITPLKDACAKEGTKDVKLLVEFQANPKPTIKWTFKDKPIRPETEGFTIKSTDTTSLLVISAATPDFVGNYTITLSNEYGDSNGAAKFRLHEPPAIVDALKDQEFLEGGTAKIALKATGVPVPEIKWTLDGKKYSPDETRVKLKKEGDEVFVIWTDDAKTDDTGHYVATVTNCEGAVTSEASIVVNTPPHVLSNNFSEGKKVVAVHKFLLEVEATAVPEATATWFVNNKEIKAGDDVKIGFDGKKYTLERVGCDPEHSGEYTCKLKNKIKEVAVTGNVTVYEKEARVRNPLQDVYVKEFSAATLKCQIVGDPVPSVEWLRDGKPFPPSGRFESSEDRSSHWHTLVFKDVAEKDQCAFTVKGTNSHGTCETSCRLGVLVKPQPGELNGDTVDYGGNVTLAVPIHAFPAPKVVWSRNGKELPDDAHTRYVRDEGAEIYSLVITCATLDDKGTYSFVAGNDAGEAQGTCELHVHTVVPSVALELKSQDVCLEDEVTFTLKCCGLPLPVPKWTKKGILQKEDDRTQIRSLEADTHTITFKDVAMDDYGKIEVVATSVVGTTTSTCELTQKTLPCEVLEGLEHVTKGAEGEDVTLSVLVRASPRPVVIWTKDGDQLIEHDRLLITAEKVTYCDMRLSLTLVEATSLESGQYRLRFSNLVNEATTETALVVRPERKAPKMKVKPQDCEVTEKGPALFKCKIAGFPRPEVKWMKDGRQVRPSDVINAGMTADGQFYLEFRHCTPDDAGIYTVVAENEEGRTEATVNLTVNPPASRPEFLQELRPTKVIRGYPCRMEVKCGGYPPPEIQWLKDGEPLTVDGKHVQQITLDDGTVILQIDSATDADAGRYTCVARNGDGEGSSSAPLAVLDHVRTDGQPDGPPLFTSPLKDTTADEGKTLRLPVAVKGGPVPDMKWYKDGQPIKLDDRMFFTYDGDRSFLEIRPCKASDSGVYSCVLEGKDGGKAETSCNVVVRKCFEAPSFSQGFNSIQQLPGLDIRLSVRADGVPRPELTWFKDNKPLDFSDERYKVRRDGEATTLLIRGCSYSDSAIYKCVATNQEGRAEHEAAVEVADEIDPNRRAEAPVFLKVMGDQEVYENAHARFKAVVSGKPIPDFQWLKNGQPIVETTRVIPERDVDGILRLTVRHVTEDDAGAYTLKVWNDYGKASCMGKLVCECLSKKTRRPVGDEYQGWDKMKRSGLPVPLPDRPFISALSDRRVTVSWNPYIAQGPQPPVTYQVEMCESPEGDWFTARTGIRGTSMDITNLAPKVDYKFRVRVENKHGVSEPSPYVATFRGKLEVPPLSQLPKLEAPQETTEGPVVPHGFTIDRDARGNYYAPPRFLRLPTDTQYGQRSFSGALRWYAFGYPTPKIRFLFNGVPLETGVKGGRVTHTQDAGGEIMVFIDKVTEKDVGLYECVARNEYGESSQRVNFELAEYPRVTQHLEETHIRSHATGRIVCRIAGYPPCTVQWYKDWMPLQKSFRIRPQFIEPDLYILNFNGAIVRDCGLYSLSAVNVAGAACSSCLVQVEDDDDTFVWTGPGKGRHVQINRRRGQLEDHYDVGDELGRGTQGITYHCVEHYTGRNMAAKSMWGHDRFKVWMHLEHEMMNLTNSSRHICRLYDAYESSRNMVLVMELCAGGELLSTLTQHQYITEYEVAHYVRQVLLALEYLHDRCIAHLGLNIGDILLTRPNGTDIKLVDLSLARTIRIAKLQPLEYGVPEYVAPEVALGKGVSYAADMWAVGIITYLLLSGTSPFRGENDRETLTKVQKGEMTFDMDAFANISSEAKDFIAKLLQFKPEQRLDVKAALAHPWLQRSQLQPRDPHKINTDPLRTYAAKFRDWYANASCRRWYRRRPLQSAFTHPSKMVYPPGEVYTPPDSPERDLAIHDVGDYVIPRKDLSYELDPITSESHYQQGPDTYLLQLRDVDFPVRLRQYMKVAAHRSPAYAAQVRENLYDYSEPRERFLPATTDRYLPEHLRQEGHALYEEVLSKRHAAASTQEVSSTSSTRKATTSSTRIATTSSSDAGITRKKELEQREEEAPRFRESRDPAAVTRLNRRRYVPRDRGEYQPTTFRVVEPTERAKFDHKQYLEDVVSGRSQVVHRAQLNVRDTRDLASALRHHSWLGPGHF